MANSINTGDMEPEETLTWENIKPYVSVQRDDKNKVHYHVLDKDEKDIFVTHDSKEATQFLRKNWKDLRQGTAKPEMPAGWEDDDKGVAVMKGPDGKISLEQKTDAPEEEPKEDPKNLDEYIKSFFDYTTNSFPKGETGLLTSVQKKFGDEHVRNAEAIIQKLMLLQEEFIQQ